MNEHEAVVRSSEAYFNTPTGRLFCTEKDRRQEERQHAETPSASPTIPDRPSFRMANSTPNPSSEDIRKLTLAMQELFIQIRTLNTKTDEGFAHINSRLSDIDSRLTVVERDDSRFPKPIPDMSDSSS